MGRWRARGSEPRGTGRSDRYMGADLQSRRPPPRPQRFFTYFALSEGGNKTGAKTSGGTDHATCGGPRAQKNHIVLSIMMEVRGPTKNSWQLRGRPPNCQGSI